MKGSEDERPERQGGEGGRAGPSPGDGDTRTRMLEEILELQLAMMLLEQQSLRGVLERYDLQFPHLILLNGLAGSQPGITFATPGGQEGVSMRDIGKTLGMPPASVTALIDRLAARGLVEREASPQDRRVVLVKLTPQGVQMSRQIAEFWKQLQFDAYTVISDEQLSGQLDLMQRLHHSHLMRAGSHEDAAASSPPAHTPGTEETP